MVVKLVYLVGLLVTLGILRTNFYAEFESISLLLFGTKVVGYWLYTIIFLPGTIIHELSHFLMAAILGVRTGEVTIFPTSPNHDQSAETRLGSVQTERTDPVRGFLIGSAPFFSGIGILYTLSQLIQLTTIWWQLALITYGIVVVGSSMLLSKQDRHSYLPVAIILAIVITIYAQFGNLSLLAQYVSSPLTILNQTLTVTILVIVVIITTLYLSRRIIEYLTGKKIVRRKNL